MAESGLKNRITQYIESLIDLEVRAGDPITVANLKRELPHIRQGLVRFMIIGQTSAGKSALINSLMSKIIVPENKAVSSPIPVWIGYHSDDDAIIQIYKKNGETDDAGDSSSGDDDILKFIKSFCYRIDDDKNSADGSNRERYDEIDYGSVLIRSELLANDITIIDTPGISASAVDNAKTIKALEDGVDFIIFLTKNTQLNADEVAFLHKYIIGDCPDHEITYKIPARNILFVNNPHGVFSADEHTFIETVPADGGTACGVRYFLKSIGSEGGSVEKLTDDEIDTLIRENVVFINAKKARVGRHGAYDYSRYSPNGCSEEELDGMRQMTLAERKFESRFEREQLLNASGIQRLENIITEKSNTAKGSVVNKRLCEWNEMLLSVKGAATSKIAAATAEVTVTQNQKQQFEKLKDHDDEMTRLISERFVDLEDEYISSFKAFMTTYKDLLKSQCFGAAGALPNDFSMGLREFAHMSPGQRVDKLVPFIIQYTDKCIATCNAAVKKLLEEAKSSSNGKKVPFEVLEEVRGYIQDQSTNLKNQIASLKDTGADKLGVAFPTDINIQTLYDELRSSLVSAAYSSISNMFSSRRNAIIDSIYSLMRSINPGFWQTLLHPRNPQYCWDHVCQHLCQPIAIDFFNHIVDLAANQTETKKAFSATSARVLKTHHEVFAAVNQALFSLNAELYANEEKKKKVVDENNSIIQACNEIEEKLNNEIAVIERS